MSINCVNEKVKHNDNTWDLYIKEAKSQLAGLEQRKIGLLKVIATLEGFRDSGEPWPLSSGDAPHPLCVLEQVAS